MAGLGGLAVAPSCNHHKSGGGSRVVGPAAGAKVGRERPCDAGGSEVVSSGLVPPSGPPTRMCLRLRRQPTTPQRLRVRRRVGGLDVSRETSAGQSGLVARLGGLMVVPSCPLVRGSAPRRAPAAGCGVGMRQVLGCRVPRDQSCGPWRSSHAHETRGVEALARRCAASRRTQAFPARCAPAPRASGSRWRGPVRRTMDQTGSCAAAGAERRTPARLLEQLRPASWSGAGV